MARSAALNPASMPFFPGGIRGTGDEANGSLFGHHPFREQTLSSMSSLSISPSEYRSVRSSPSPPQERNNVQRQQASPAPDPSDRSGSSPSYQHEIAVSFSATEDRTFKDGGALNFTALPEREDKQRAHIPGAQNPGPFGSVFQQRARESISTPPVAINHTGSGLSGSGFTSASPVSSLDSGGQFTSGNEKQLQSFEAQLKSSPMVQDLIDRLVRCEFSTREIQRDLGEMHRKVNLLVEHALGSTTQPEFKDPFALNNIGHGHFSNTVNAPRPSHGNIAPNQPAPTDDIASISQRLNTLTSSVGQLLALQTQQLQPSHSDMRNNSVVSLNLPQADIAPNQILSPPPFSNSSAMLGHNRSGPSPRQPNSPMRTWSAGTLDLPMRPSEPNISRQLDPILRDNKRRSVSTLLRRESSGMLDTDSWNNTRDSGPIISKWEQLSLAPELLRSLAKFGVGPPNKIQQRALPFLLRGADIIAQAPPTQERIAAYVIPAIQVAVTNLSVRKGPVVILVSTTVDQATQAQRMIRDLGGPIGVRSALGVGTTSASNDLTQELRLLQQNIPHIICGTPQKLHALFTSTGGLLGSEVRLLVLDEVDQLIARNLHEFVFNIVKLLPPPRTRSLGPSTAISGSPPSAGPSSTPQFTSPFETNGATLSPFQNSSLQASGLQSSNRRFSAASISPSSTEGNGINATQSIERQTALFSNTVPQDVLNLASAIHLREPVRVLVRRDGGVANPETSQGSRGLRQFYLYLAFTAGGRSDPMPATPGGGLGIIGSGRSASSAETTQAREWKLEALTDMFDDVEVTQAIVHVGGMTALDSVVYKLASRGLEAIPLHGDMNAGTKLAALNKFRNPTSMIMRQPTTKVLVVYDVQVKTPDVTQIPLIINYDLPKAVEEYAHRVAPAVASNYSRAGVIVNFVTATGGDVEMLRSIECFYKIKCPEVPSTLRDII